MEVGYFAFKFEKEGKLYSQSVLFFLLALCISLWCNVIVLAGPSTTMNVDKDSRIPLSKRVLDSSKKWRAPEKKKNLWRQLQENSLKIQQGRIKNKSSSLYDSIEERKNWDPYSNSGNQGIYSKAPTLFKFRF